MPSSLNFELHTGPGGRAAAHARRVAGAAPVRLLLLGDFSGRSSVAASTTTPRPATVRWSPKPRPVDIDNLDAVMQQMAPKLRLQIQGQRCEFAPQSLDDFHPDHLLQNLLPLRQGLARLRALQDPAQFSKLVPASAAGDLLGSLLGGKVQAAAGVAAPPAPPRPPTGIEALLHSAVAGQVVPAAPAHQAAHVAAAQAALADELRAVLHNPAFQALEGAWRGVQLLVSRLELGEQLQLHLVDATLPDVLADLVAVQGRVEATALGGLFAGTGGAGGGGSEGTTPNEPQWSAAFGLFSFGVTAVDLGLMATLGTAAAHAQMPFVATASLELEQAVARASADATASAQKGWETLRRSAVAPWLGLVSSPLLLRLPYGPRLEPVQAFAFEEIPGAATPAQVLWGPGAIAAAALFGQSCADAAASGHTLDDLPAFVRHDVDDEAQLQACAGRYLNDVETEALLSAGLMPLVSHRQRSAVLLPRWQSVAEPQQALRGLPFG